MWSSSTQRLQIVSDWLENLSTFDLWLTCHSRCDRTKRRLRHRRSFLLLTVKMHNLNRFFGVCARSLLRCDRLQHVQKCSYVRLANEFNLLYTRIQSIHFWRNAFLWIDWPKWANWKRRNWKANMIRDSCSYIECLAIEESPCFLGWLEYTIEMCPTNENLAQLRILPLDTIMWAEKFKDTRTPTIKFWLIHAIALTLYDKFDFDMNCLPVWNDNFVTNWRTWQRTQTEAVTFLGNQENSRSLYAIPGLDYVAHEDILPYVSSDKQPIQHELFEKFLANKPNQDPAFVPKDTLRSWQEKNHPWLELSDVHKETTENVRITVIPFYMGCRVTQSSAIYWVRTLTLFLKLLYSS